ncbi:hypothetical protein K439DRAFT_1407774 [Ramaria rubella]|nr:hypothetical protein K439DRAFT_1407774 [Ramaria rubella]
MHRSLTSLIYIPGPDSQRREDVIINEPSTVGSISVSFVASTLHLRGASLVPQPHVSEKSVFCWNGEVFEGLDLITEDNDGAVLSAALDALEEAEDIYSFISSIEGPYAFVYYQRCTHRLFFARDPLGRRSLLFHRPTRSSPFLILSSTSAGTQQNLDFEEVDPRFIYSLDVCCLDKSDADMTSLESFIQTKNRNAIQGDPLFAKLAPVNKIIPVSPECMTLEAPLSTDLSNAMDRFLEALNTSVRLRVQNIPRVSDNDAARVAVLFSGGIDSTMIAFLAHRHMPLDEPIDLLNVAFENPRKLRSRNNSEQSKRNRKKTGHQNGPPLVDMERNNIYDVPDRLSGLEELEELRQLCPGRQWNFVEVDIDYTESSQARRQVEDIMLPNRTVMDLSLALALYFAARGKGKVRKSATDQPEAYTTPARVLLNGLGSDELLGGYGRHRSAFQTGGWGCLIDELQLELDRLPSRNLGRDDRMISCHGKETRHPFLSLSVVGVVAALPVHLKTDPRLEVGLGDKLLLRLVARNLGLKSASRRKKRAMQFGSHSARMETTVRDKEGDSLLPSE